MLKESGNISSMIYKFNEIRMYLGGKFESIDKIFKEIVDELIDKFVA